MTKELKWIEGDRVWTAQGYGFLYTAHHWPVPNIYDLKLKWDDLSGSSIGQGSLGTVQQYAQSHHATIHKTLDEALNKYRVEFLDKQHGTPCERIRHEQEIEDICMIVRAWLNEESPKGHILNLAARLLILNVENLKLKRGGILPEGPK